MQWIVNIEAYAINPGNIKSTVAALTGLFRTELSSKYVIVVPAAIGKWSPLLQNLGISLNIWTTVIMKQRKP